MSSATTEKTAPEGNDALSGIRKLDANLKAFVGIGVIVIGAFAAGARGCTVSASQLDEVVKAQHLVDAKQEQDLELLFQTNVRLTTIVEGQSEQIREVRKDLRAMDAGRPLPPLPVPTVHPTPAVP